MAPTSGPSGSTVACTTSPLATATSSAAMGSGSTQPATPGAATRAPTAASARAAGSPSPASAPSAGSSHRRTSPSSALALLIAAALGAVFSAGAGPAETGAERALGALAIAAILGAPGVLALLARRGRPPLLVVGGITLVPLSLLSFAGATLPLLVPAVLLVRAGTRRSRAGPIPCAPASLTTLLVLVLDATALVALLAHQDPRTWGDGHGGGSTSDVVTVAESLVALGLVALAVLSAWYLATPLPGRRAPGGALPAAA